MSGSRTSIGGAEILRTFPAREPLSPPVTIRRISDDGVRALRQAFGIALIIEPDVRLGAASFNDVSPLICAPTRRIGQGFTVTVQVMAEGRPTDRAGRSAGTRRDMVRQGADRPGR